MGAEIDLPACGACGADDCWGVEGPTWTLEADLRCTNCDALPEGAVRAALLARYGSCRHAWTYREEFGALPVNCCDHCGLTNIDPRNLYGEGPG